MKKLFKISILVFICTLVATGCGKEKSLNLSPSEIIDKIYEGMNKDEMPGLNNIEVTSENMAWYLGVDNIDIKSGIASEPLISSIAWSVVVIEVNDKVDVKATKETIKSKVNPAKWVCTDAEEVIVENRGNKIILIMMDEENAEYAKKIQENFKKL